MGIKDILGGGLIGKATEAFKARREGKNHEKTLEAKIVEKTIDTNAQVTFNQQEWEVLKSWQQESTWKDEYVTVSVVAIFNIIIIGGLAQAFGFPQILEGIVTAIETLNDVMVSVNEVTGETNWTPMGTLISVTIFAAIGVYSWKKLF